MAAKTNKNSDEPARVEQEFCATKGDAIEPEEQIGDKLDEMTKRYHSLFNGMTEGFALYEIICDDQGHPCDYRFLEVNPAFETLMGLKQETVVGKTIRQIMPDIEPVWIETCGRVALTGESNHFEQYHSALKKTFEVDVYCPAEYRFACVFKDITERKHMEEALRRSERLYRSIGETIDYGIWVCDPNGRNIYASESFLKMVGITQQQCSDFGWGDVLHPDDAERTIAAWKECVRNGGNWDIEHRFRGVDGQWHAVLARGVPVRDEQGRIICWAGINLDISRLKRAEEALVVSETRYRRLFEAARDGILILDAESGQIVDVNPFLKDMLGYSHEEFLHKKIWEIGLFKHMLVSKEAFLELQTKGYVRYENLPLETKNGRSIAVEFVSNVYWVDHKKVIQCNIRDITLRKQAEEALRQSREDLDRAQEVANIGSWRLNVRKNELTWSDQNHRIFGIPKGTPLTYETFLSVAHPEDRQYVDEKWLAALRGEPYDIEHRILVDGKIKWVRERAYLEVDAADALLGGFGITQDITAFKQFEEEIKSLAKFPSENPFPVLRISGQGDILYSNGPGTVLLEQWNREIGQKVPEYWRQIVAEVTATGRNHVEEIPCGDHIYSLVITPVSGMNYCNIYGRDITVQRNAEQALRLSRDQLQNKVRERTSELAHTVNILQEEVQQRIQIENQLRERSEMLDAFFSHTITPLVILDRQFNFIRVNAAYARACQREIYEFEGHNHFEFYPNQENQRIFEEVVRTKKPFQVAARPFSFPDHPEWGLTYWDWSLVPILDDSGEVEMLVFSLKEVTESKLHEQFLRLSESRLSEAQRIAHLGNWEWDLTTNEIWWSDEVYRIFGIVPSKRKISLKFLLHLVHPEDRGSFRELIADSALHLTNFDFIHRILKRDGTERMVHVRAEPFCNPEGKQTRMRGTVQDVTEQTRIEAQLRRSQEKLRSLTAELEIAEERERRRIAGDLHDSVGQILAFSTRELKGLQKGLPQRFAPALQEITDQLDQAIKQARTLSFDLSPSVLYDLGLEHAIEELTEKFSNEKKIQCHFTNDPVAKPLAEYVKILLYRAVRELLINIMKHADATRVHISIRKNKNHIEIGVEDDGRGFDAGNLAAPSSKTSGFGLFNISQRLDHLGGQMEIVSTPGKGVKVKIIAPLVPGKEESHED